MQRYDIYAPIHKGLRREMSRLQSRLGAVDPNSDDENAAIVAELRAYLELAQIHLHDEDTVIHPQLEARLPGSTKGISDEHAHHRRDFDELRAFIDGVENASKASRREALHALYLRFTRFVAEDLAHLHREETETLPLLHEQFSDAELRGMEQTILATVPPDKLMIFIQLMLPAMNHVERFTFLSDARANAPSELYDAIVEQGAKRSLAQQDWARLKEELEAA